MSYHFTERDLDLIQLEELHSDSGYADWFGKRVNLDGWKFESARHSVFAEVNDKWGETDLLAFFVRGSDRIAVLIEDKVAAAFAERQAQRYRERGNDLVNRGECQSYMSVLVAPSDYLNSVPADDPWNVRLPVEDIAEWFSAMPGSHAAWRAQALYKAIDRVRRISSPDSDNIEKFSSALAAYLARYHAPTVTHKPGRDKSGPILRFPQSSQEKTLWWKFATSQMTLQLMGRYQGLSAKLQIPLGIELEQADKFNRKCDYLVITVPPIDVTKRFEDQLDIIETALDAALKLISIVQSLDEIALP